MSEWLDADMAYNDTLMLIEHARRHLHTLLRSPDADELDIASARADLAFHTSCLPKASPAQDYQDRIKQARKARHTAADGKKIPTEKDIADVYAEPRETKTARHSTRSRHVATTCNIRSDVPNKRSRRHSPPPTPKPTPPSTPCTPQHTPNSHS